MASPIQRIYPEESVIALGRNSRGKLVEMRGRLINAGDNDKDLHSAQDGGGTILAESPYPLPLPLMLTISSTDAGDNILGDGARQIYVRGLDEHYQEIEMVIDTAGLSGSDIDTGLIIHNELKVQKSGDNDKNLGDIFIGTGAIDGAGRPATVYGCINAGDVISYTTVMMLACNQVGLVKAGNASVYRKNTNSSCLTLLCKREFHNGGFRPISEFPTFTKSNSHIPGAYSSAPKPIGPRDMLKMTATRIDQAPEVISGDYSIEIWTLKNVAPLV